MLDEPTVIRNFIVVTVPAGEFDEPLVAISSFTVVTAPQQLSVASDELIEHVTPLSRYSEATSTPSGVKPNSDSVTGTEKVKSGDPPARV